MGIPHELVEQIARRDAVIFVGSGLSMGAGLPGWSELLSPLAESIDLPQHLRTDLPKVAQYYEDQRGRHALISHVIEQTDTTGKEPTDNHYRLARLGLRTWVTTNYDDLIEQALREAGERFTKVVRDQDLPYASADAVTLVKLHGDREQPETIVITQQDYYTYFRGFPRVKDKLIGLLLEKTVMFVGYSISDPDFNQIQAEIAFDLQQHQRMAYTVLFDADEFTISDLRWRNVHVLNIPMGGQTNYSERFGELLDELIRQVAQARQQRAQAARPTVVPAPPKLEDVHGLLEAMGYRITDTKAVESDLYFLCDAKWGAEIRQEVVHFVGEEPTAAHIAALNDAVVSHNAARGTLLTRQPLPAALCDLARQRERIQCYTLDEFTDRLADFRPYLQRLTENHEASEIPQFYVPLAVESEAIEGRTPQVFKPLASFMDAWLAEPGRNHISILGDFGSGKTWFCQRYAYLAAKRYLADPAHNRIPILITLRNYSRAYDAEQLITDAIANRYKVGLASGYKTFARLNEAGRLLLIFDGFDEMEQRVSDYRTTVDNFWRLANIVSPASKVLLTCRTAYFRHQGEEKETLTPRRGRVSVAAGDQVIDLRGRQQFEVVHLMDFDDEDIRLALQKRLPARWEPVYQKILELSNLRDLASRPVLLDMIIKTLPQIQEASQINQATLYAAYIDALLQRRWSEDTDFIPPQDRLFFVQELACEMYTTQRLTIPFSEFPERVTTHFGLKDDPERAAFFERDVRTQSYLVRDDAGNYRFAHKSFIEYFIACKMAETISSPVFDAAKAVKIWKTQPLTPELRDFLVNMVTDSTPLWRLIEATQDKAMAEVGYAGGNAVTLLQVKGESFVNAMLSSTVLAGALLFSVDLTNADLRAVCLRQADLSGCILEKADLREADLVNVRMEEMEAVYALAWSPDGQWLASGGEDGRVRVWDSLTWEKVATLVGPEGAVRSVCWSPSSNVLASGTEEGLVILWDPRHWEESTKFRVSSNPVTNVHFKVGMDRHIGVATLDGTLGVYDCKRGTPVLNLGKFPGGAHAICFSSDKRHIAGGSGKGTAAVWQAASGELVAQLGGSQAPVTEILFCPDTNQLITFKGNYAVKVWSYSGLKLDDEADADDVWERYYGEYTSILQDAFEQAVEQYCAENRTKFEEEFVSELSEGPDGLQLNELKRKFFLYHNPGYFDVLVEWAREWIQDFLDDEVYYDEEMSWQAIQELKESLWPRTCFVGFVECWDIRDKSRKLFRWGTEYRGRCLVALPGKTYAIGNFNGDITIWESQFASARAVLKGHSDHVNSLCLNLRYGWLASGSDDATIRIWDVNPDSTTFGQCLKVLEVKMNCQGMRIGDAKGLDAPAPDGKSTLEEWLKSRGAVE